MSDVIHQRLSAVNHQFIVQPQPTVEAIHMPYSPQPEDYAEFKDWIAALSRARDISKAGLARIAEVTPQAVTKWFNGGSVDPDALSKIATLAGIPYHRLRLKLEGQPPPLGEKGKYSKHQASQTAMRLMRKIELLERSDARTVEILEELIDSALAKAPKTQKHG